MTKKKVIIIGAGISGLSTAWYLQNKYPQTEITLLEKSSRVGGKLETRIVDGPNQSQFTVDLGPESFITRKPEVWDLAHELGIHEQLDQPGSETANMYILKNGEPMPAPLSPGKFFSSKLLSTKGKLRMVLEPFIPGKRDWEDESLADFVDRRLGVEARKYFIGPVLAGIYNTDPERQSILVSSPIMREMEREHGSLIGAMIGRGIKAFRSKKKSDSKKPRFVTFKEGAERLVDEIVEQFEGQILLDQDIRAIKMDGDRVVVITAKENFEADALIIAAPANAAAVMLDQVAPDAAALLKYIRHTNIGTISLAYADADLPDGFAINGLMIPRHEDRRIDAITFTSTKMPERSTAGYTLFRVFFGAGMPETCEVPEEKLVSIVKEELRDLLGIETDPVMTCAESWPQSFPQADVGHLDLVDQVDALLPEHIFVTGSSYRGIGVPDCIRQAKELVESIKL